MALPPAPFNRSRIVTTVVATVIWWVILYGTGVWVAGGSKVTHVVSITMANAILITYLFVPYFATHSVLMGGLRGVLKGRILLPQGGAGAVDESARPGNAWRAAVLNALIFGALPAVAGFLLVQDSRVVLSARQFGVRFATGGALLAAVVAFLVAGSPLLQAMRVPRGKPRFDGDPKPYLWEHHVLPHAFANLVINAALAFSLSPVPFAHGAAMVPAQNVVIDTAIAFVALTLIISGGVKSQARTEAEWGIAPPAAGVGRSLWTAALTPLVAGIGFAVVVGLAFWLTHTAAIGVYTWAVFRGLVFGVYAGWLAKSVAQAAIHGALSPRAEAVDAETEAVTGRL